MIAATGLEEALGKLHAECAIELPVTARRTIGTYLELLGKWNQVHNITAIRDPERMVTHHVLDSLAVLPHLPSEPQLRVLDVGSGGGLPGLLLAIARPDWQVVMIDSNYKKGAFLRQAVVELGIANAEVITARVEEYEPEAPFDVVISRAFADLATFAHTSARHLARDGQLAAMKGVYPDEELADLPANVRILAITPLAVPGVDGERHLVVMRTVP